MFLLCVADFAGVAGALSASLGSCEALGAVCRSHAFAVGLERYRSHLVLEKCSFDLSPACISSAFADDADGCWVPTGRSTVVQGTPRR